MDGGVPSRRPLEPPSEHGQKEPVVSKILKFPDKVKKQTNPEQPYELVKEHCHVLLECLYSLQNHVSAIEQAALGRASRSGASKDEDLR
jgi:hypothetical protein